MAPFSAAAWALACVLSLPFLISAAPALRKDISVVYMLDKHTTEGSIIAHTADHKSVLGESCDAVLNTGDFKDYPLSFHVNDRGSGNLRYGSKTYNIHHKTEHSGGIICHKRYNQHFVRINCLVPYQGTSQSPITQNLDCFPSASGSSNHSARRETNDFSTHLKRSDHAQLPTTRLIGDGFPHQNWWNIQFSETVTCSQVDGCQSSYGTAQSVTFGFSVDAVPDWEDVSFIDAGFSVEESTEISTTETCTGDAYESTCMWAESVNTAYTVDASDAWGDISPPFVMYAPNVNQLWPHAKGFYCVVGTCRDKGSRWWNKTNAPLGGPEVLDEADAAIEAASAKNGWHQRFDDADYYDGYTS